MYADYQKQAIKSALKKNYSVLKQALDRYQADNGGERIIASDIIMSGSSSSTYNNEQFINVFKPYLNILYDCGETRSNSSCVPSNTDNSSNTYKTYNGNNLSMKRFDDGQLVLNDGSLVLFEGLNSSNDRTLQFISVDVNGYGKKPNRLGRDLFMFELNDNGELLPEGAKGTQYYSTNNTYCSNTSTNTINGAGCTAKVLQD